MPDAAECYGDGCELRRSSGRLAGVFARRAFAPEDVVMVGRIDEFCDDDAAGAEQIGEHIYVRHGGLVGQVNHSCDPNVGVRVNGEGAHDFVALRSIAADEEITFDLAMRNYEIRGNRGRCQCGASNCRGRITGWKDLPAARKADYRLFAAPYLTALDSKYLD